MSVVGISFEDRVHSIKDVRDRFLAALFFYMGLKTSQVAKLKIDDINSKFLLMGNQEIPLTDFTKDCYKVYIKEYSPDDFLFYTRQSNSFSSRRIQQILAKYNLEASTLRNDFVYRSARTKDFDSMRKSTGLKSIRRRKYITDEEYDRLLSGVNILSHRIMIRLFFEAGLTLNDSLNTKYEDIENLLPDLSVKKSLPKDKDSKDYVLNLSPRRVQQLLNEYGKKAHVECSAQILRNSYLIRDASNRIANLEFSQLLSFIYQGIITRTSKGGETYHE